MNVLAEQMYLYEYVEKAEAQMVYTPEMRSTRRGNAVSAGVDDERVGNESSNMRTYRSDRVRTLAHSTIHCWRTPDRRAGRPL